ncbi:MAG TPA: GxxExxY protein, partial [Gemmatimonadaceae bacterium]|nr:GxxExxY protein [Gemmatimonadaceae bacterium]
MSVPVLALDAERALPLADERPPATRLVHEHTTGRLLAAFFAVHRELGHGFADAVYLRALILELVSRGVQAEPDVPLGVFYKGRKVGSYAADLLVEGKVVVLVRGGPELQDADRLRLLNCMRCSQAEVGMLLHFGPRPEFRRYLGRVIVEQGTEPARVQPSRG